MERLTIEMYEGKYVPKAMCSVGRDGLVDDCDSCIECCENSNVQDDTCNGCTIQQCFNRLAEYEDTGLTPDKIRELYKEFSIQAKELKEYRKVGTVEECQEARERQIPKKCRYVDMRYYCPECHCIIKAYYYEYCPECGQAIER